MLTKESFKSLTSGDINSFNEMLDLEVRDLVKSKLSEKTIEIKENLFLDEKVSSGSFFKRVSRFRKKMIRRVKKAPPGSKIVNNQVVKISGQEKINRTLGARAATRNKLAQGGGLKQRTARKQRISKKLRKTLSIKN